ncbi:MAG: hypothetical protein J7M14_02565 [Planctomycetes bacterium]|nr:hypothetical protein [Planctomycetota bacterium]
MTFRAIVLGLLGGIFIAVFAFLGPNHLGLAGMIVSHFPIGVFGPFLVLLIFVNPLLYWIRRKWRFKPAELAVILMLPMIACSVPMHGLMTRFVTVLALPIEINSIHAGWRKHKVLDYAPKAMLPGGGKVESGVLDGLLSGKGSAARPIGLSDVPWKQWRGPIVTWMPLAVLLAISSICLGLIVHPQWSKRERLRYPIVEFTSAIMEQDSSSAFGTVFRRKAFWIAFALMCGFHLVNGIHAWFPESIEIPLKLDLTSIRQKYPGISKVPQYTELLSQTIWPLVVALAFFLATDVSFSLGLSQIMFAIVAASLLEAGVNLQDGYVTGAMCSWARFGAALGYSVILVYIGRRHYWNVLVSALSFRVTQAERYTVWACRLLLLSVGAFAGILIRFGLPWPLAVATPLLGLMLFLTMARLNAECGLFYLSPRWQPLGIVLGLFGSLALSPHALVMIGLVSIVLTMSPMECLLPFVTNGLKICELKGLSPPRTAPSMGVMYVIALACCVPVVLWAEYNFGIGDRSDFQRVSMPKYTFDAAQEAVSDLKFRGQLQESVNMGPLERLVNIRPRKYFTPSVVWGFALVVGFSICRLRYTWWPLHPAFFLIWGTWQIAMVSHSFLLGWLVKIAVIKFGDKNAYRNTKILMIGIIAGEVFCGLISMVVSAIYYAATGLKPITYSVFL